MRATSASTECCRKWSDQESNNLCRTSAVRCLSQCGNTQWLAWKCSRSSTRCDTSAATFSAESLKFEPTTALCCSWKHSKSQWVKWLGGSNALLNTTSTSDIATANNTRTPTHFRAIEPACRWCPSSRSGFHLSRKPTSCSSKLTTYSLLR